MNDQVMGLTEEREALYLGTRKGSLEKQELKGEFGQER